jgi:hypothetical protein
MSSSGRSSTSPPSRLAGAIPAHRPSNACRPGRRRSARRRNGHCARCRCDRTPVQRSRRRRDRRCPGAQDRDRETKRSLRRRAAPAAPPGSALAPARNERGSVAAGVARRGNDGTGRHGRRSPASQPGSKGRCKR